MKMLPRVILFTLLLIIIGVGVSRLTLETELTSVLPDEVAQVEAVKSFHQYFADDQQIVVLLRSSDGQVYPEDVEELVAHIESDVVGSQGLYQSIFDENPALFAQEVGKIWAVSRPELVTDLHTRLTDQELLQAELRELKEQIRNSFQSGQAIRHSYDPLGLMRHPGLAELAKAEYSFESDDGQTRFFFLKQAQATHGYQENAEWVTQVRQSIESWMQDYDGLYSYGLTGGPVYSTEVGAGMQGDMTSTVAVTLSLIGLLFLVLQRSVRQLLLLVGLVTLTFLITLGLAGWIMPSLNALSVGFAAILLGLVIDYVVVLLRESRGFPADRHAIRKGLRGSILWAAGTTMLVFSVLILSSFPGVRQLGLLIMMGLGVGAITMLWGIPLYTERSPRSREFGWDHHPRASYLYLLLPTLLLCGSIGLLVSQGGTKFNFSLQEIQPRGSEASLVQTELSESFSSWSELRTIVFAEADSSIELEQLVKQAHTVAQEQIQSGLFTESFLPAHLVPYPQHYQENITKLQQLIQHLPEIQATCERVGFTTEGLKFDLQVFDEISSLPSNYQEFTSLPRPAPLTKGMITEHDGRHYFRGNVVLREPLSSEHLSKLHELNHNGLTMTGWGTMSAALEPLVRANFRQIFLPATGVILIGLLIMFRNAKEVGLVLLLLLSSLTTINALMALLGIDWNFLNIIAFPLIIGVGIDYSIHLIFALRRNLAKPHSIWRGVGVAIAFCGLSSIIGFGSLTLANSSLLRELGIICGLGVAVTLIQSLLVIPPVWYAFHRHPTTEESH